MADQGTILVVDDSPSVLAAISLMLESAGYLVLPAGSGDLALQAVKVRVPDLALLDVRMPGIDGFALCRLLHAIPSLQHLPVIFLSAATEAAERLRGFHEGGVDYIGKPFQSDEGLARIRTHLELARTRAAARHAEELRTANERLSAEILEQRRVDDELAAANAALAASEQRYRLLYEESPVGIGIAGMDGVVIDFNPAMERIFRPGKPLRGENIVNYYEDPAERAGLLRELDEHGLVRDRVVRLRRGDGTRLLAQVNLDRIALPDGHPCLMTTIRDVTEQFAAEERFRNIVESSPMAMHFFSLGPDGRLVLRGANGVADRMLGIAHAPLCGLPVEEAFPPLVGLGVAELFHRIAAGEKPPARIEYWYEDSRFRGWFDVTAFRSGDGQLVVEFFDIGERKAFEAKQRSLQAQLVQSQKLESIGTMASGVAHEINNPLTGVINLAQLLLDRLDAAAEGSVAALRERLRPLASEVITEAERIVVIVRNLLDFARQDRGEAGPVRIGEVVDAILSLSRKLIEKDDIVFETDLAADLPPVRCRPQQIQQVLLNLVTNARDSLNQRYPGFDENKRLLISTRAGECHGKPGVHVEVLDHGTGIPEGVRSRIFDPFFTTKEHARGTGLGLSISYGIIKDHGGEIAVESVPGSFIRFTVSLPAC